MSGKLNSTTELVGFHTPRRAIENVDAGLSSRGIADNSHVSRINLNFSRLECSVDLHPNSTRLGTCSAKAKKFTTAQILFSQPPAEDQICTEAGPVNTVQRARRAADRTPSRRR
jgi:hypothetical protein